MQTLYSTSTTTELEQFITEQRQQKEILLMSHVVLGYPSCSDNRVAVETLVNAGVELIELQFPFSEPIADGPLLLNANQAAIQAGTTIEDCFRMAEEITSRYRQTRFVIMTYCNILFKFGLPRFIQAAANSAIAGLIVPDLPPECANDYINACRQAGIATIFLFTPKSRPQRLKQIANVATGLIYCAARKGVTGYRTQFSQAFEDYIQQARAVTSLPIGVGFGIQSREDVDRLSGQVDVAIVCTQAVKVYAEQGAIGLGNFIRDLRA